MQLAGFMHERAASELGDAKLQAALEHVQRAEKVLAGPLKAGLAQARISMFEALRLEARILKQNAQASISLERLERAAELAPDRPRLALVLAETARVSRDLDRAPRFLAALAELERRCGDLEFPLEPDSAQDEARSVRRWTIEQRISDAALHADASLEFAALVELLDRCGDGPLSPAVFPDLDEVTPEKRIGLLLSSGARARAAWLPFEEQARAALAAAKESGDGTALERVARLFPHTSAARDARDARLRLALDAGDARTAVRTAFEELPLNWSVQTSTAREAQLVWLAAQALKHAGNPCYARSLLQRLAQFQPRTPADERDPTTTFAMLAQAQESAIVAADPAAEEANFDEPAREVLSQSGENVLLGKLDLGERSVFILAARDRFDAISADGTRLWRQQVEGVLSPVAWLTNALLVPGTASDVAGGGAFRGRVVIRWRNGVKALDAATGAELWTWSVAGGLLDSPLAQDAGVLTVAALPADAPAVLVGIDLARGTELWRHECSPDRWIQPVVGSGLAVLLPRDLLNRSAEVLEIATGTVLRTLDVGQPAAPEDRRAAWIEAGRMILPRFQAALNTQDALVAFDLDSGAQAWRVRCDGARTLDSIVRCGPETYLVYLVRGSGTGKGGVHELDTRLGTVGDVAIASIGENDMPIGLRPRAVTPIEAPYLFLRSPASDGKGTLVRTIHLPYGERWVYTLKVAPGDHYGSFLPLPAVSSRLVALAYPDPLRPGAGRNKSKTSLVLIHRDTGELANTRGPWSESEMGAAEAVEMATLGNLLFVCGKNQLTVFAGSKTEEHR